MNTQNAYLNEIEFQKKMIQNLQKWMKVLFLLSSTAILLITLPFGSPFRILGIVLLVISILLEVCIGWAIYNGRKNVNKVIDAYASIRKKSCEA